MRECKTHESQVFCSPRTSRVVSRDDGETYVLAHTDGPCYTPANHLQEPLGSISLEYLDDAIAVVNKPAFLPTENTRHIKDSARQQLESLLSAQGESTADLRLPHRLDWETSGLLVFARGADSTRSLVSQFAKRQVHKAYIADVLGSPPAKRGHVDIPLSSDLQRLPLQRIDYSATGKRARTEWEVVYEETPGPRCRLKLWPQSGRRHQLRMHCLALGCPIANDALYLPREERMPHCRLHLHAAELGFRHPCTDEAMCFTSEPRFLLSHIAAASNEGRLLQEQVLIGWLPSQRILTSVLRGVVLVLLTAGCVTLLRTRSG